MKAIKAKIKIDRSEGNTTYIYPQIWLDNKDRIPSILYANDRSTDIEENGEVYQLVYPLVPDDVYDELIKLDGFTAPDKTEMEAYAEVHMPVKEIVTDQSGVVTLLAKAALGTELTAEETKVLDPQDPTPGINLTKSWSEKCAEYGVTNL